MNEPLIYPLDDVAVLDLSKGIAGAYCAKLLADGGANVVKVETADGDPLRRHGVGTQSLGDAIKETDRADQLRARDIAEVLLANLA